MNIDVTISDTATTTASLTLTYRAWIPGNDPWVLGGSGLLSVTPTDWSYDKPDLIATLNASFGGGTQTLMQFNGFKGSDGAIGDSGSGSYIGPIGSFGQVDQNMGIISWQVTNIY